MTISCNEKEYVVVNGVKYYKEECKKTGYERTEKCSLYWFLIPSGAVDSHIEYFDNTDNTYHDVANYYSDRNLAENINRLETLTRKIRRWQAENDKPVRCGCKKFSYKIANDDDKIVSLGIVNPSFNDILFTTKEKAEECIEEFKDELLWAFTEFKPRLDM